MRHESLIQGEIIGQVDGELGRNIAHEFLHEMTEEHTIIVGGTRFLQLRSPEDDRPESDIDLCDRHREPFPEYVCDRLHEAVFP